MVSQPSVLLPKQPFEQAYTSHLVTFSVGKIICISALCLELGPSARFFKVPTVGTPSGVVLGNYIGNGCMNKHHVGLIVHANCRWHNRYDSTQSYMICIILCVDVCKMVVYLYTHFFKQQYFCAFPVKAECEITFVLMFVDSRFNDIGAI